MLFCHVCCIYVIFMIYILKIRYFIYKTDQKSG